MTRLSARSTKFLAAAALLSGAFAISCSKSSNSGSNDGRLKLALTSAGVTVNTVHYQVLSSATPPVVVREGDIDTSDPNSTASVYTSVPAGTGYIATLTANTAGPPVLPCVGSSMPFNVIAGQEIGVTVQLVCGGSTPTQPGGSVIIDGTVVAGDNCPLLTSWSASPLQTSAPSGQIDVAAAATDADATETLTFTWTATNGTFVAPTSSGLSPASSVTKYTCTTVGPQTLTVTVVDNHLPANCTATQTFPVNCANTVFCGNGVVDPGTTEQCDPPTAGFCDNNCQNIPPSCGDTFVQAGEQCDPPVPGVCSATCQNITPVCGDGFVQAGEQCEPPNTATCSATCQNIVVDPVDFSAACQSCEVGNCDPAVVNTNNQTTHFGCLGFTGQAQTDCLALLNCIRTNHCAAGDDAQPCYCGTAAAVPCLSGMANGICKAAFETATELAPGDPNIPGVVGTAFFNPTSPVGEAVQLLVCDIDTPCVCGQ